MQFPLNRKVFLASAIGLATHAGFVQAGGFGVNEHSAGAMGTAYAGRASNVEDGSIASANPGGIAFLDSQQVTLGSAVILEAGNFKGQYVDNDDISIDTTKSTGFLKTTAIPFGYYVLPINDKMTFGLAGYAPFGLNLDYDDQFAGRYFGDKTIIQNMNLQSTFAYKVQDNLSVGFGLSVSYFNGELTQKKYDELVPGTSYLGDIDAKVTGDDTALTWNMGVIWKPTDMTTVGVSYHAKTDFTLDGDIKATNMIITGGVLTDGADAGSFKHKGELKVTMPERAMFSVTHHFNEQWTVMADAVWTHWSVLDSLAIIDKDDPGATGGTSYLFLNWRNTWGGSIGTAYRLNEEWTLKAGYMFDQSPVTDENRTVRAPDADRNWLTAGAKWSAAPDMTIDFSAAYVMMKDGKIDEGEYTADGSAVAAYGRVTGDYTDQAAWILAAQMTYRF